MRKQPVQLQWPLTPSQVESVDEMLCELYRRVGELSTGVPSVTTVSGTGVSSLRGFPGDAGEDGEPGPPGSQGIPGPAGASGSGAGTVGPPGFDGEDSDVAWPSLNTFSPNPTTIATLGGTNAFTGANSFATNPLNLLVGQITFPATQNPSSDVNTLDDYEEGTWTPTWTASVNPAIGNGTLIGQYTRVGNLIQISIQLVTGTTTTFGTGNWNFSIPFSIGSFIAGPFLGLSYNATTGATFSAYTSMSSGTTFIPFDILTKAPYTATVPFVWATAGSFYQMTGTYRIG